MLVVEPVRGRDVGPVADLALRNLREQYGAEWLSRHASLDSSTFMVAREVRTNTVLGFAVAAQEEPKEGHLLALAVDPQARGQGIGRALLQQVREDLARAGNFAMSLEVRADDRPAQAFYSRQGFRPVGLEEGVYSDGASAVRMSRPL